MKFNLPGILALAALAILTFWAFSAIGSWGDRSASSLFSGSGAGARGTGGRVDVKGYARKDGTYVQPHTRSAPKSR